MGHTELPGTTDSHPKLALLDLCYSRRDCCVDPASEIEGSLEKKEVASWVILPRIWSAL